MTGNSPNDHKWELLGLGLKGFIALCGVITALIGAGFFAAGRITAPANGATPAVTVTVTVTATPATPATPATTSAPVYYQGSVGIGENGLDFDSKPPGPGPGSAVFSYGITEYGLTTLSNTGGFAVWPPQGGTPTASECKTLVTTHLTLEVDNVVNGMQICFRTDQGRIGLLRVEPGTTAYELNAIATVWGP